MSANYYSLNFSGEEIDILLNKINTAKTLAGYGITDSYTRDEILNLLDNTLKGDSSTSPSLYIKTNNNNNYSLVYIDSNNTEHELFDFENLNIPKTIADLSNDKNYVTTTELEEKIGKKRGGLADHVVLSTIDGDIAFSDYTILTSSIPTQSQINREIASTGTSTSISKLPTAETIRKAIDTSLLEVPALVDKAILGDVSSSSGITTPPFLKIDNNNDKLHYQLYYMDSDRESHKHELFDFSEYFPEKKDTVLSFNSENDEILAYMNKDYKNLDDNQSNVNSGLTIRKDIPEALVITRPSGASYIKIINCETNYEWEEALSNNSTTYQFKNLIPNKLYRFYFLDANKNTITYYVGGKFGEVISGTCMARGQIRMIDTPLDDHGRKNLFNIRDIGGWKCQDGVLKYGLIYRGCRLDGFDGDRENSEIKLSLPQKKYLTKVLNIEDEIDLRGGQSSRTSSILDYSNSSNEDYDAIVSYERYVVQYYQNSLKAEEAPLYASIIHRIAQNLKNNKVTYIHCSAGADRTAQVCALIEALCGVSRADIDRDFEITSYSFEYDSSNAQDDYIYTNKRNSRLRTDNSWKQFMNFQGSDGTVINGSTLQDKVVNLLLNYHESSLSNEDILEDIRIIQNCLIERNKSLTKVSELENDKGYLVATDISNKINKLGSGNTTIIKATNDGNIERSPYQITEDINKVNSNTPTHNYIPTAKLVGQAIENAPFVAEETGFIADNNQALDYNNSNWVMSGKYTKIGNLCILQATARLIQGWQDVYYSLPIAASTYNSYTTVYQNGVQYIVSTGVKTDNQNQNVSVLNINRLDGNAHDSNDTIQFTLTYSID